MERSEHMPEIKTKNENKAKTDFLSKLAWFTDERCINGLPSVAVLQLVLALLLYMIAAIEGVFWFSASAVALVLGLIGYYLADKPIVRILLRVLFIVLTAGIVGFGIAIILMSYNELKTTVDFSLNPDSFYYILIYILLLELSVFLFVQAAVSGLAKYRRRFDLVLLRIIGIIVLVFSVLFCVFGLEYGLSGSKFIVTSFVTPEIFGKSFKIGIDNIATRAVFCLLSLSYVFMSFKLGAISPNRKSNKENSSKALEN
jgi:hypothetical protein